MSGCARQTPSQSVEGWNRAHPLGSRVRFWPGLRDGPGRVGTIRAPAQLLGCEVVAWVTGYPGCIAVSHIAPDTEGDG